MNMFSLFGALPGNSTTSTVRPNEKPQLGGLVVFILPDRVIRRFLGAQLLAFAT